MKPLRLFAVTLVLGFAVTVSAAPIATAAKVNSSSHSVKQYKTKKGTVVHAHKATNPNGTKADNYAAKGNVNPNGSKKRTKKAS